MIAVAFYKKQVIPETIIFPDYVIIGANKYIKELVLTIHQLPDFVIEKDFIMQFIFDVLHNEQDAMLELSYNAMEMVYDGLGTVCIEDIQEATDAIIAFGTAIFAELKVLQIYKDGLLPYQFLCWFKGDIMLAKTDLEKTQDGKLLSLAGLGKWP